jgi:hypothetical protein
MTSLSGPVPFGLDPLIAEANGRMRRRRLQIAAIVLVLAATGATLAFAPIGLIRTGQSYAGPYFPGGMFRGSGGALQMGQSGPAWGGLSAVSAASRSDAWAFGSVAWHWDGRAWRSARLPRVGKATLWAADDAGPRDAWAVGALRDGYELKSHALIEHWDGARWSVVRLPHLPASYLFGVSAAGPSSAWAVGGTYAPNRAHPHRGARMTPLLLHWDGRSWAEQSLPWAHPHTVLDRVVATGPSSVWAFSDGQQDGRGVLALRHWNGRRWQTAPTPFGAHDPLGGFSATAWNDAWAVGGFGYGGNRVAQLSRGLAAHWNGHTWQMTALPGPPAGDNSFTLVSVDAAGPDDVLALGESQRLEFQGTNGLSATGPVGYLLRWNGQSWQAMPGTTPVITQGYPGVAAGRDGSAWAIGWCSTNDFVVRLTPAGLATVPPASGAPHQPPACSTR